MNITFDNVSFKYIERKILDNASFSITTEDKVGVVGVNGTGKSTLLKLIMELEKPNSGIITKSGGIRINYLPQNPVFDESMSLFDIIMKDSTKEFPIVDYEAKSILSKLGFKDSTITPTHFSGGQLKRLAIAKALVTPCDLLILDEPTNHLDNTLIMWLEKYLTKMKNGLLMVTHDRYFLQRVCNKMLELENGKLYMYDANYDKFLELKAMRIDKEAHEQQKLKSLLRTESEWIHRGAEARRTKAKNRVERFKKLSEIEFKENKTMEFSSVASRLGKKLISMKDGKKAFGDHVLFDYFSFDLNRSDIIGVVGDNGAGKSTLFKILMGEEKLTSGTLEIGETLKIGYFSQTLELINPEVRVIDYIAEAGNAIETLDGIMTPSTLLDNFLFTKELQYSKVKMLSGGEKRRLQLVKVLITNPNMLLFDEPTNDLDLYTLEVLEDYMLNFKGPIMVVSHDRYFLDKVCNKLFVFNNGYIDESLLSFSEYISQEIEQEKITQAPKEAYNTNKMPAKLRNELTKLEEDMPKIEKEISDLKEEQKINITDYKKLLEIDETIKDKENQYDTMMERYFELSEIKDSYKK